MWIPISTAARADALSQAIWDVRRPPHVRDPEDVTDADGNVVVHPTTGEVRMQLPLESYRVHAEADPAALDHILLPLLALGNVEPSEVDSIRAAITANRGGTVLPEDLIPSYYVTNAYDDAAMAAAGFWG